MKSISQSKTAKSNSNHRSLKKSSKTISTRRKHTKVTSNPLTSSISSSLNTQSSPFSLASEQIVYSTPSSTPKLTTTSTSAPTHHTFQSTTPTLQTREVWKHDRALEFSDDDKKMDIKIDEEKGVDWKRSTYVPQSYYQISKSKRSIARHFADVNASKPREYWDYQFHEPNYSGMEGYMVGEKLGQGKFSEVFEGYESNSGRHVVIKVLKPVKKDKIKRETLILSHLVGSPGVSQLFDVVRDPESRTVCLVFDYQDNAPYKPLYESFTLTDIKRYVFQLLSALDATHRRGIMHRDIKPGNILIDHKKKRAVLSDWGLAEFYHPHAEYHCRVATKGYKAPELLLNMPDYDYAVDMWALGTTMANMIFKGRVIAHSTDDLTGVRNLSKFSGSDALLEFIEKYDLSVTKTVYNHIETCKPLALLNLVNSTNVKNVTDEGLDLLSKMMVVDPWHRVPAHVAMRHPFFDEVRHTPECAPTKPYVNQSTIF